ncbi:MAG: hypothetical protein ABSG51_18415 [Terracidiphilus sp.]|jgi:hypothetical protein
MLKLVPDGALPERLIDGHQLELVDFGAISVRKHPNNGVKAPFMGSFVRLFAAGLILHVTYYK